MNFTTPVELPKKELGITHRDSIMLAGSCFASNIGSRLQERKFNIEVNPFGVLYNPLSIAAMLKRVAAGEPFSEASAEIFEHNGLWHSILHHGDFSRENKGDLLECINARVDKANVIAKECDAVFVTFGTAYAYILNSSGTVAGNCHKLPGGMFTRRLLGIREIVSAMSEVIEIYRNLNKNVRFIFTVSPIRHLRDGAHDNQKSKSTLLLAIDEIMQLYPENTHYFPAYEIVLDELRDYRYYADDMVHPSNTAIEYIWECFAKCYFNEETIAVCNDMEEIVRALNHRPFDAASDGYRRFVENLQHKIESIAAKYPYLDLKNEIMQCNTLLKK